MKVIISVPDEGYYKCKVIISVHVEGYYKCTVEGYY